MVSLNMSESVIGLETMEENGDFKVIGYDDKDKLGPCFIIKSSNGHTLKVADTFAEMFPLWVGRILITANDEKWALKAAEVTTGFATSVIMAPAEAGIEAVVPKDKTPDGRIGVLIQIYNSNRFDLKNQMLLRIGQCIMTCPTTAAFDALTNAKRRLKIGRSLRYFADGFQKKGLVGNRRVWQIPVMDGEFMVEDTFGVAAGVAGGNFLILAKDRASGLMASEEAVKAVANSGAEVILPFPGGICRSGSKAGSLKYKLKASTNHPFCPSLKSLVADSQLSEEVNCVYEIVINGLTFEAVKKAMGEGVKAALKVPGVIGVTAGNYGGKLGPYKAFLKEVLNIA